MHPSRRSAANWNHSFLAATWVIAVVRPACDSAELLAVVRVCFVLDFLRDANLALFLRVITLDGG